MWSRERCASRAPWRVPALWHPWPPTRAVVNMFKLPEWLQVELVQLFGRTMEHTPWYRFDFMGVVGEYWRVLASTVLAVRARHGGRAALFSSGFATNAVPAVVMSVLLAQLKLLALPLLHFVGDEYDADRTVEELVVESPAAGLPDVGDDAVVNSRHVGDGLHVIVVRTFKAMSRYVVELARATEATRVLTISGRASVLVKVAVFAAEVNDVRAALSRHCVDMLFSWSMPVDGEPVYLAMLVHVPLLLEFVRRVDAMRGVRVAQVYDFFD